MRKLKKKPNLDLLTGENAEGKEPEASAPAEIAKETHLRIMVEQMVREGRSVDAIEEAVRQAA
jgi:hypothetical protein